MWAKTLRWFERIPGLEYWSLMLLFLSVFMLLGLPLPRETGELRVPCAEADRIEEGGRGVVIANHLEFPPLCHSDPMCRSGAQTVRCDGHEIVMFSVPQHAPFEPGPGPHALLLSRPGTFFVAEDLCVGCTEFETRAFEAAGWRIAAALAVTLSFALFVLAHRGRVPRRATAFDFVRTAPATSRALDGAPPSVSLQPNDDEPVVAHSPHMTVRAGALVACDVETAPRFDLGLSTFRESARELRFVGPGKVNGLEVARGASHELDHGDVVTMDRDRIRVHAGARRLARYRLDGDRVRVFETTSAFAVDLATLLLVAGVAIVMLRIAITDFRIVETILFALAALGAWKGVPALRRRFIAHAPRSIDPRAIGPVTVTRAGAGCTIAVGGETLEELAGAVDEDERALTDALAFEAEALFRSKE